MSKLLARNEAPPERLTEAERHVAALETEIARLRYEGEDTFAVWNQMRGKRDMLLTEVGRLHLVMEGVWEYLDPTHADTCGGDGGYCPTCALRMTIDRGLARVVVACGDD